MTGISLAQKSDIIRLELLAAYGGVWVNPDVIVVRDLIPYVRLLHKYDFVGFGCYSDKKMACARSGQGMLQPGNWLMASRPGGLLVTLARDRARWILENAKTSISGVRHAFGRLILWKCIAVLVTQRPSWKYFHVASRFVERDEDGRLFSNQRLLSNETLTAAYTERSPCVPLNMNDEDFPFPAWFLDATREDILERFNLLITRIFRWSLLDETPRAALSEHAPCAPVMNLGPPCQNLRQPPIPTIVPVLPTDRRDPCQIRPVGPGGTPTYGSFLPRVPFEMSDD